MKPSSVISLFFALVVSLVAEDALARQFYVCRNEFPPLMTRPFYPTEDHKTVLEKWKSYIAEKYPGARIGNDGNDITACPAYDDGQRSPEEIFQVFVRDRQASRLVEFPVADSNAARTQKARGAAQSPAPNASGRKDPFTYTKAVNSCVAIVANPQVRNAAQMQNRCAFGIRVTYCMEGVVSKTGQRVDNCARGIWQEKTLSPGGKDIHAFDGLGLDTVFIACPTPYYLPGNRITYARGQAQGRCQKNN